MVFGNMLQRILSHTYLLKSHDFFLDIFGIHVKLPVCIGGLKVPTSHPTDKSLPSVQNGTRSTLKQRHGEQNQVRPKAISF